MADYNNPLPGIPTDKVLQMRAAGLSNNQIIQNLQREGFMQSQIFDAMNQAEVKMGVTNIPQDYLQASEPANPLTMGSQAFGPAPSPPHRGPAPQMPQAPPQFDISQMNSVSTEELIEALIDEKWNELVKDITKIAEWKERANERIAKVEQEFEDLKRNFDDLHRAVVGKIGEYDKHILDVGAEIQAMEKVFQKVLPTFTEKVNELSRITDTMKKK